MPRRFRGSGLGADNVGFGADNVEFSSEINGSIIFNTNNTIYPNAVSKFSIINSISGSSLFSTDIPSNLKIQFQENEKSLILKISTINFGDRGTIIEASFEYDLQSILDRDFQALTGFVASNNLDEILNLLATTSARKSYNAPSSFVTYDSKMEKSLMEKSLEEISNDIPNTITMRKIPLCENIIVVVAEDISTMGFC